MLDLSGYYIKAAQIIASKGDFIPEQWIPHLSLMFDAMPARPWPRVARVSAPFHCLVMLVPLHEPHTQPVPVAVPRSGLPHVQTFYVAFVVQAVDPLNFCWHPILRVCGSGL